MVWICFGRVFSSNSKGRCFGLSVGLVWFWVWIWFFSFSNSLLPALTFRNDLFINLNMIWICFGRFFSSISNGRCFGLDLSFVWFWFGLVFSSLTPYSPLSLSGIIFSSI